MRKKLLAALLALALLLPCCLGEAGLQEQLRARLIAMKLAGQGLRITADDVLSTMAQHEAYLQKLQESEWDMSEFIESLQKTYQKDSSIMFDTLMVKGWGVFDYETDAWTPTSDQVYAFDAEVYDIENMYTLFLQGVQAIVPEVSITDVKEDLSKMTDELEGKRGVSFLCNGRPYSVELESMGDWIDLYTMLDFVNGVLKAEGCKEQLHNISNEYFQIIILVCSDEQRANRLKSMIDYLRY